LRWFPEDPTQATARAAGRIPMKWIDRLLHLLGVTEGQTVSPPVDAAGKVLIVGSPNVGKSLLFNRLTGQYVTVSNYPGTTVEVTSGLLHTAKGVFEVIDTPGIYSFNPITAEEKVTYDYLFGEKVRAVIHVVDSKNLERMLPLTLQLAEAGLPLILVLNMTDEARDLGMIIDIAHLQERLGLPVIPTTATTRAGIRELVAEIPRVMPATGFRIDYGPLLEQGVEAVTAQIGTTGHLAPRTVAVLLLQSDKAGFDSLLPGRSLEQIAAVLSVVAEVQRRLDHSAYYYASYALKNQVSALLAETVRCPPASARPFRERLSRWLMQPLYGVPILILVLYFGLYQFVGVFGAGYLVDAIQTAFTAHVSPWADRLFQALIPWPVFRELFIGEYGIIPLGLRYALAIIFPIVGTFFIAFSILEDSGYLPRLAMLIDRVFKRIGLNGRAVIPIVLGFGCGTMATMVTRTLETRRERVIATFLLALAIPCSAQMGVIMGVMAGHPGAMGVWLGFVAVVFLTAGFLASRLIPGQGPSFYMELPPLRLPRPANILVKTMSRMTWYFKEVLPLFILASVLIWLGQLTGIFDFLIRCLQPVVRLMDLPPETARIFLFGFFRRDYGAAGLYDLQAAGILNGNQLTVAAIALTLFLPCVAQFLIMGKERGWRTAGAIGGLTLGLAVGCGWLAEALLRLTGITL
jgi:ferrous iron transport protein B